MLFPLVFVLLFTFANRRAGGVDARSHRPRMPLFIVGFVLFSLVPTFGLLPESWIAVLKTVSHDALIVAMAGIGLRITLDSILRQGRSALAAGTLVFAVQILFSTAMVRMFF